MIYGLLTSARFVRVLFYETINGVRNMYKNFLCTGISGRVSNVILRRTLHVIFGCLSNVILNHLSNVIFKHLSNVILGFIPRIHVKSTPMDPRDGLFVTPEDDSFEKPTQIFSKNGKNHV